MPLDPCSLQMKGWRHMYLFCCNFSGCSESTEIWHDAYAFTFSPLTTVYMYWIHCSTSCEQLPIMIRWNISFCRWRTCVLGLGCEVDKVCSSKVEGGGVFHVLYQSSSQGNFNSFQHIKDVQAPAVVVEFCSSVFVSVQRLLCGIHLVLQSEIFCGKYLPVEVGVSTSEFTNEEIL